MWIATCETRGWRPAIPMRCQRCNRLSAEGELCAACRIAAEAAAGNNPDVRCLAEALADAYLIQKRRRSNVLARLPRLPNP